MRTVGWLLFSPLVVTTLIKKSVPGERLVNVNVLCIKKKSHIKTFSSNIWKAPTSCNICEKNFTYKICFFIVFHRNNLLCVSTNGSSEIIASYFEKFHESQKLYIIPTSIIIS